MLFNSLHFLVFFPVVVALYFATPFRFRWILLLTASYYFYAAWKAEYLVLIIASTVIDYGCALAMARATLPARRKLFLVLSLCSNLGLLFAFKYFNFFNDAARELFQRFNLFYEVPAFDVLLPVGISFYTFQTLSYTIDVYRGKREPERHLGIFALYVSFFPQLVAGPIERSSRLLPQFFERHEFDYERVTSGLRLILWGFFKKVVIADRLAIYVNAVYSNPGAHDGPTLLLATYFFAFQIYCDFSGYSDIAIGTARVMGYELMQNFRRPYFARSIAEFWQRWHISLSTWFRDYLYIPLGGNRVVRWRWYVNLFAVFLISGLWHGANWTFIVWGALHGCYLVFSIVTSDVRERAWQAVDRLIGALRPANLQPVRERAAALMPATGAAAEAMDRGPFSFSLALPSTLRSRAEAAAAAVRMGAASSLDSLLFTARIRKLVAVFTTFHLVLLAWVFFRANSLSDALLILHKLGDVTQGWQRVVAPAGLANFGLSLLWIGLLLTVQLLHSRWEGRDLVASTPTWLRWTCYYLLIFGILLFGEFGRTEFIYFQF